MSLHRFILLLIPAILHHTHGETDAGYYGRYIGPLSRLLHGVSGEVYAVDTRTLHIRDFTYDGEGPAAYFYAGNTKTVAPGGFFVRDETGSNGVLKRYNKKHITITLPEGKTLNNIRWFSVWCEEFTVNFGDIQIPRGLDFPKPQKINQLSGVHGVSSDNIVIVDAQTLLIPSFSYDGEAPDAKFWVGRGPKPSPQGIRVPDENGKQTPLRRYERKTIVLTLPGDLTIFDIGHFGVWCEAFTVDFGHVQIPPSLNVPPSLKMLGVSPQKRSPGVQTVAEDQRRALSQNALVDLRATTYRPPTSVHRFSSVQLQPSVSLTPEPLLYTQQQQQQQLQQQSYLGQQTPFQQQYNNFGQQQQQQQFYEQQRQQQNDYQQQLYRRYYQQPTYSQEYVQQPNYRHSTDYNVIQRRFASSQQYPF